MIEQRIWDQIVVDRRDRMSPFRQIATAIRHKIATNQLAANTPLPSVRSLADQLGVTATTVARAYRDLQNDGLVESRVGIGTVVSDTWRLVFDAQQRSAEELERTIDQALLPLLQMGYAPSAIHNAVQRRLAIASSARRAIVVSDARPIVEKYTTIMRRELTLHGVIVDGLLLEQLKRPTTQVRLLLQESSRVMTALGLLHSVRDLLNRLEIGVPISVIFTELSLSTMEQLSAIPKDAPTLIVTEERYRSSALGILRQYLPDKSLSVVRSFNDGEFEEALARNQFVVHSLGMSEMVRRCATNEHPTILMDYQVRQDALAKLCESFIVDAPVLMPQT
jgi:DNA-binding transcriptional regulator YhcF (GntR family)